MTGNDTIFSSGDNVTITGGDGANFVSIAGSGNFYHSHEVLNDKFLEIVSQNENVTLIGDNKASLPNDQYDYSKKIFLNNSKVLGEEVNAALSVYGASAYAEVEPETIICGAQDSTIKTGVGSKIVTITGGNNFFTADIGNISVVNSGDNNTIDAGTGGNAGYSRTSPYTPTVFFTKNITNSGNNCSISAYSKSYSVNFKYTPKNSTAPIYDSEQSSVFNGLTNNITNTGDNVTIATSGVGTLNNEGNGGTFSTNNLYFVKTTSRAYRDAAIANNSGSDCTFFNYKTIINTGDKCNFICSEDASSSYTPSIQSSGIDCRFKGYSVNNTGDNCLFDSSEVYNDAINASVKATDDNARIDNRKATVEFIGTSGGRTYITKYTEFNAFLTLDTGSTSTVTSITKNNSDITVNFQDEKSSRYIVVTGGYGEPVFLNDKAIILAESSIAAVDVAEGGTYKLPYDTGVYKNDTSNVTIQAFNNTARQESKIQNNGSNVFINTAQNTGAKATAYQDPKTYREQFVSGLYIASNGDYVTIGGNISDTTNNSDSNGADKIVGTGDHCVIKLSQKEEYDNNGGDIIFWKGNNCEIYDAYSPDAKIYIIGDNNICRHSSKVNVTMDGSNNHEAIFKL